MLSRELSQNTALLKLRTKFVNNLLDNHLKPFIDADMVNECFINVSNVLFDNFINKNEIISRIKRM